MSLGKSVMSIFSEFQRFSIFGNSIISAFVGLCNKFDLGLYPTSEIMETAKNIFKRICWCIESGSNNLLLVS